MRTTATSARSELYFWCELEYLYQSCRPLQPSELLETTATVWRHAVRYRRKITRSSRRIKPLMFHCDCRRVTDGHFSVRWPMWRGVVWRLVACRVVPYINDKNPELQRLPYRVLPLLRVICSKLPCCDRPYMHKCFVSLCNFRVVFLA